MAEEEFSVVVADNGSGTCNTEFAVDLESVFVKRKVNAWKCAQRATDRDLESVFNVNAWICACQTTDRDLETKK